MAFIALGFTTISCDDDDDGPTTADLILNLSGLENLGDTFQYEGWIIIDGLPVSTGTFTIDNSGTLSQTSFSLDATQLAAAARFVLSIEPIPDADPLPAPTKILAGDFSGNSASLWVAPVTEDADDFSTSWGQFFLRTPTDEIPMSANNGNDESGIWFGIHGTMPPGAGFGLPTLAAGWAYEGWVIGDAGPLSTGTFTSFNHVDSSNVFSGMQNNVGPPIPGEDFFLNTPSGETFPLDVRDRTVVISIEPIPDNSPAPFTIKPLVGTAGQTTAPTTYDLGLNLSTLPTGTVTR